MYRLNKICIIGGFLVLVLLVGVPAHSKPWRQFEPIPASRITWQGLDGLDSADKTRMYALCARANPIEAYPIFSNSVARVYVRVVDGDQNLNIHLVKEGYFRASGRKTPGA